MTGTREQPHMTDQSAAVASEAAIVSEEALHKAQQFIEEEEGAANRLTGWLGALLTLLAVGVSIYHLYAAYGIVPAQVLRPMHVALLLLLTFLLFPVARRFRHRVMWWDFVAAALAIASIAYMIQGGDDFMDRNTTPAGWDIVFGVALIALVMEAMRRTNGWIMPAVTGAFILYALLGAYLPQPWTHKGYEVGRLVGPPVHDAGRHLRRRGRRVLVADHPVHDLRRVPAVLRRRQVLHRLLLLGDGRQAHRRRAHGGAGLVPAGRPLGLRRGHHGDARLGGLADAGQGGLRAQRRAAACSPPAAWARSSRRRCWAPPPS